METLGIPARRFQIWAITLRLILDTLCAYLFFHLARGLGGFFFWWQWPVSAWPGAKMRLPICKSASLPCKLSWRKRRGKLKRRRRNSHSLKRRRRPLSRHPPRVRRVRPAASRGRSLMRRSRRHSLGSNRNWLWLQPRLWLRVSSSLWRPSRRRNGLRLEGQTCLSRIREVWIGATKNLDLRLHQLLRRFKGRRLRRSALPQICRPQIRKSQSSFSPRFLH